MSSMFVLAGVCAMLVSGGAVVLLIAWIVTFMLHDSFGGYQGLEERMSCRCTRPRCNVIRWASAPPPLASPRRSPRGIKSAALLGRRGDSEALAAQD
jgi:hypothetical protein